MKSVIENLNKYLSHRNRRQISFFGALVGLALAQGAPIGLILHTYLFGPSAAEPFLRHVSLSINSQASIYLYVWLGTSFYFSLFGWIMAWLLATWLSELNRTRNSLALFTKFDNLNRQLQTQIHNQLRGPTATIAEFLDSLRLGLFGNFSSEQSILIHQFLEDIAGAHLKSMEEEAVAEPTIKMESISEVLREFGFKLDSIHSQMAVAFDAELLKAAVEELLREIRSVPHAKWKMSVATSPVPQWKPAGYLLLIFHSTTKFTFGPGWTIARYIIEWHGGRLGEQGNMVEVILPLARFPSAERTSA